MSDAETPRFPWRQVVVAAFLPTVLFSIGEGAIIPMGPVRQFTADKPGAPITLHVYTGANGAFALYDDDGVSEAFRTGAYSRIPIRYEESTGMLTLDAREGKGYAGMWPTQEFRIRWETPGRAPDPDGAGDAVVQYTGAAVSVTRR